LEEVKVMEPRFPLGRGNMREFGYRRNEQEIDIIAFCLYSLIYEYCGAMV
jgi:hypothetical protein